MTEADRINRVIHEWLGKGCWHEQAGIWDYAVHCLYCDEEFAKPAALDIGKRYYTTDLNAVREAELKVIEKFGIERYGKALTKLAFSDGVISDDQHGAFLITADAKTRAAAVIDVIEGNEK